MSYFPTLVEIRRCPLYYVELQGLYGCSLSSREMMITKKTTQSIAVFALMSIQCSGFQARRLLSTSSWFRAKPPAMSQSLQGMYDSLIAIHDVRSSTQDPWSCKNLLACVNHMADVTLDDLSLAEHPVKKTCCVNVAETPHFQIAAFLLPKDRTLPIHDHPGMSVISKVIAGELRVTSFTAEECTDLKSSIKVKLHESCIRKPIDKPWIISPTIGNYHEFTARSDCVILDVLLPPYAYPERPCHYYNALPEASITGNTDISTDSSLKTSSTKWVLNKISDLDAHRLYGLPTREAYSGYVPHAHKQ